MSTSGIMVLSSAIGLALGVASVLIPVIVGATDSYEIADPLLWMGGLGAFLGFLVGLVTVSVRSAQRR